MKILTNLFRRRNLEKFKLKYNKKDSEWVVMRSNAMIFAGSQQQCEKFMDSNYDAYI